MTMYVYACPSCARFEAPFPMGTAPEHLTCPRCGSPASRRFTTPNLGLADRGRMALIDRTSATADAPPVVTSVPGAPRRRTSVTTDPRHARLPRP